MLKRGKRWFILAAAASLIPLACNKKEAPAGGGSQDAPAALSKGVGPIQSVSVGAVDEALVAKGQQIFTTTCAACHKLDQRLVGPALGGVTKRRSPEWIMNMVLNSAVMTQQDADAKALFEEYKVQMLLPSPLKEEDARAVLEFLRKGDGT
ncbi:MAG: cytochrome c [Fibrobacteres bacterium]|nr:cytochrome c [Fibrobacterota bacterium]